MAHNDINSDCIILHLELLFDLKENGLSIKDLLGIV